MKQQRSPQKVAPAKPVARPVAKPVARPSLRRGQSTNDDQNSIPAKHKFVPEVKLPPHIDRHRKRTQGNAEAQYNQHTTLSMNAMPGPKREFTLEEKEEEQEKFHRFLSFFSQLDDRERDVLRLRFGLDGRRPKTLAEVGELFHLSGERIRQIQTVALAKLRAMIEDEKESASEAEESD